MFAENEKAEPVACVVAATANEDHEYESNGTETVIAPAVVTVTLQVTAHEEGLGESTNVSAFGLHT